MAFVNLILILKLASLIFYLFNEAINLPTRKCLPPLPNSNNAFTAHYYILKKVILLFIRISTVIIYENCIHAVIRFWKLRVLCMRL